MLATNKIFPAGSSTTDEGSEPVGKGEPVMGLRLPAPGLITKPMTVLVPPAFVTYRKSATGFAAAAVIATPAANGDPGKACKAPLLLLIENAEIVPAPVTT